MADPILVKVPDLGDFADVEVIDVLVKPGDSIEVDTPLVTLETDKATMDVPSTMAGRVARLCVERGARVSTGSDLLYVEATAPAAPPSAGSGEAPAARAETASATAAAPAPQTADAVVSVPELGDFKDVEIIEVLVKVGDEVELDSPLITLETDKATMDVPSTRAGRIAKIHVAKGARVNPGDPVVTLAAAAARAQPGAPAAEPAPAVSTAPAPPAAPVATARIETPGRGLPPIEEAGFSRAHASPSVRRFARELGVDLSRVSGSGRKGRITADDVKSYVKARLSGAEPSGGSGLPAVPEVDFAAFGPVKVEPLTRIQRISGPRLHASWLNIPHVTQHDEADITELEQVRAGLKGRAAELGIKVTPLAFVVRACAGVLSQFPRFLASLDSAGNNLVYKQYVHIGFAADTPNGLVVPVIRDANRKDIYELARELGELSARARAGRLAAAEMQGGCFTITSLGGIGGTAFTPIINAPEVAILGVSKSAWRPVWREETFVPRLILPLSLSYDHRVIDGAEAVRFTVALGAALADPKRLLEAVP